MRISDWSSDVCSSDLMAVVPQGLVSGIALSVLCGGVAGSVVTGAAVNRPFAPVDGALATSRLLHPEKIHAVRVEHQVVTFWHRLDAQAVVHHLASNFLVECEIVRMCHRYPPSLASEIGRAHV